MIEIKTYILRELNNLFSVNITEDLYNESFFSTKIGLEARNFIDLLYFVEKEFNVHFEESTLTNSRFPTINGLVEEVKKFMIVHEES